MRSWEWRSCDVIGALIRRWRSRVLSLSLPCEDRARTHPSLSGCWPSPASKLASTLTLDFLTSRIMRNKFLLFKPSTLWKYVIAAQDQNNSIMGGTPLSRRGWTRNLKYVQGKECRHPLSVDAEVLVDYHSQNALQWSTVQPSFFTTFLLLSLFLSVHIKGIFNLLFLGKDKSSWITEVL